MYISCSRLGEYMKQRVLCNLVISFFRIGLFTFGGGYAMLTLLEDEVVQRRKWLTHNEVLDLYAIGQTTPGVIMVNVATFIGFKKARYIGAIMATAAVAAPSLLVVTLLVLLLHNVADNPAVQKALTGINIAVAAMLCSAVLRLWQQSVRGGGGLLILCSSFFAVQLLGLSAIVVIPAAALVGLLQWKWGADATE